MLNTSGKDPYLLNSVYHALEVLDLLSQNDELSAAEISNQLKYGKSNVFRLLYTLEIRNYVYKSDKAKYRLGLKFANYGAITIERQNIVQISRPILLKLRDKYNETVHLAVLDGKGKMLFAYKESSTASIQMTSRIGFEVDAYCTASGKMLLSNLDSEKQQKIIDNYHYEPFTPNTIVNKKQLLERLKLIKQQGYSEDNQESEIGLTCYASPIFDYRQQCIAAISFSGPTVRMHLHKNDLIASLKKSAREISLLLGYTENKP